MQCLKCYLPNVLLIILPAHHYPFKRLYLLKPDFGSKIKSINMMSPSAPKQITWFLGLVIGVLGIVGHYAQVEFLTEHNYLLLLIGFILLAIGTTFRGI